MFKTENLSPMQLANLNKALDKQYRFNGVIKTLRQHLAEIGPIEKSQHDGMIDYNRQHFNNLDYKGQAAYMARLRAKRYYSLNGWHVPKVVFDAVP
jgi:hypothetical protein